MCEKNDILHKAKKLRLLAAALELQHFTGTAANVVPIPGGDLVVAIGTPAQVAQVLAASPATVTAPAAQQAAPTEIDVRHEFELYKSNLGEAVDYIGDGLYGNTGVNEQAEAFRAGVAVGLRAAPATAGMVGADVQTLNTSAVDVQRSAKVEHNDLTTVRCPACVALPGLGCDECHGQGRIIVSRTDLAAQQAQASAEKSELTAALDAKAALLEQINKAGAPSHTDYWHQSLWEADERIRKAQASAKEGDQA